MSLPPISRRAVLIGGLSAGVLGLAACGGGDAGTGASTGPSGTEAEPTAGGTLRFAVANDPASLTPQGGGSGNDARYVTRQLVDSLLDQDPETGELAPWLAQEWEINEEATEFTFHLREGVTFSDGTPLTAQSIKDNFADVLAQGAQASYAIEHLAGYVDTEVVDEQTAIVRFDVPSAPFLQALTEPIFGPLAASTLALPWEERVSGGVIGTGPFVLDRYTKDTEVVLSRRVGYAWPSSLSQNTGEAYLDEVVFQIVPEASVRTGSLSSGQVDVIGGVPPQDQATLEGSGYTIVARGNPGTTFGLTPYNAKPIVGDVNVRRALSLALNRTDLRDATLNESYAVSTSPLAATTPGWVDLSEYLEQDVDEAARLLEESGWVPGADGIRERDGERLALVIAWSNNFVANQSALELLQQQAKEVGIEVELWTGDVSERTAKGEAGEFDLTYGNLSRADGDILRTSFAFGDEDPYRVADEELNVLLEEQRGLTDVAARNEVLARAQERILEIAFHIPTFELTSVLGTTEEVHGVALGADSRLTSLVDAFLEGGAA
ncbi:ABC transporter substrate-binding protein [Occultella kanbiaonis]|uniref:ABC transporter substrate-binding protein n=1 Tax=Occultella kanbiaonis TaxID=2675754 RepID=UPI00143DF71B|nr:ABC transporter substrate-binding protein [Occultella kanbiaonis]